MSTEEEIVTFETYYNPMLAEIMRAKLEANGIPCLLADEAWAFCTRFTTRAAEA
ncbi:MAG TPA: hypothetical protein VHB54_03130 [Mucilaginibacter sp.]|nr:hypothetical protein [Mucilaginibacter sp.]